MQNLEPSFESPSRIGNLLVASTVANHPIYAGGVCLVVHEDAEHTIGVMLNRPLQPSLQMMSQMMQAADAEGDEADDDWSVDQYDPSDSFAANDPAALEDATALDDSIEPAESTSTNRMLPHLPSGNATSGKLQRFPTTPKF